MLRYIHQLSAAAFYLLGASFFVSYVLFRNSVGGVWPAWWMQVADLPLVLTAVLYGGLSLYLGLHNSQRPGRMLALGIAIPLGIFFLFVVVMDLWGRMQAWM